MQTVKQPRGAKRKEKETMNVRTEKKRICRTASVADDGRVVYFQSGLYATITQYRNLYHVYVSRQYCSCSAQNADIEDRMRFFLRADSRRLVQGSMFTLPWTCSRCLRPFARIADRKSVV